MILEEIDLYEYFRAERQGAPKGKLVCYRHGQIAEMNKRMRRPAILVLPGGGYEFVSQREAEPVAIEYYREGFDAFVLDYDVAPDAHYPCQIKEAAMAMMYIRKNAEELDVLPDKIAEIGFSAGGHLCGWVQWSPRTAPA